MADRFSAEITIGGRIPLELLDELVGVVETEGLGVEWGVAGLDKSEIRQVIVEAAQNGRTARFVDDQACYGWFEDLESWLTANGVDFDRYNECRYEYEAQNVYGRGSKQPVVFTADQEGVNLVYVRKLRKVLTGGGQPTGKLKRIAKLIRTPSELGPIVLVDASREEHE